MLTVSRSLALLGALALVIAAFLPWTSDGRAATAVALPGAEPTLAIGLLTAAAVPAVSVLFVDRVLPLVLGAVIGGALVLAWLGTGPDPVLAVGTVTAVAGVVGMTLAAGLMPRR